MSPKDGLSTLSKAVYVPSAPPSIPPAFYACFVCYRRILSGILVFLVVSGGYHPPPFSVPYSRLPIASPLSIVRHCMPVVAFSPLGAFLRPDYFVYCPGIVCRLFRFPLWAHFCAQIILFIVRHTMPVISIILNS